MLVNFHYSGSNFAVMEPLSMSNATILPMQLGQMAGGNLAGQLVATQGPNGQIIQTIGAEQFLQLATLPTTQPQQPQQQLQQSTNSQKSSRQKQKHKQALQQQIQIPQIIQQQPHFQIQHMPQLQIQQLPQQSIAQQRQEEQIQLPSNSVQSPASIQIQSDTIPTSGVKEYDVALDNTNDKIVNEVTTELDQQQQQPQQQSLEQSQTIQTEEEAQQPLQQLIQVMPQIKGLQSSNGGLTGYTIIKLDNGVAIPADGQFFAQPIAIPSNTPGLATPGATVSVATSETIATSSLASSGAVSTVTAPPKTQAKAKKKKQNSAATSQPTTTIITPQLPDRPRTAHVCEICLKDFKSKGNLKRHNKDFHEETVDKVRAEKNQMPLAAWR